MGSRPRPARALRAAITALLAVTAAGAQQKPLAPTTVGVVFPDCPREPFPYEASLAALRVELALEGVERVERLPVGFGADGARIVIHADCVEAASAVTVEVVDPRVSGALRRTDLTEVPPPHRPRAVALVAAELGRSVWTRPPKSTDAAAETALGEAAPSANPTPPAAAPAPRAFPSPASAASASVTTTRRSAPARPRLTITPALVGRLYLPASTALVGPGARVGWQRLWAGAEGLAGPRDDALGRVTFGVVAGAVGADLLRHRGELGALHAGPRATAGVALAAARASDDARAGAAREAYVDLALALRGAVQLTPAVAGSLALEGGAARGLEIYADERRVGVVGGGFLGARLGVTLEP